MKAIYIDKITSVGASDADPSYPASNVQDDHPKKVWKATTNDANLILTVDSGANALGVFNTNAEQVQFVAFGGNSTVWEVFRTEWEDGLSWEGSGQQSRTLTADNETFTEFWFDYTQINETHNVWVRFYRSDSTAVYAGVLRCGYAYSWNNPLRGLKESYVDYSIVKELNNGAVYIRDRDIVRLFRGRIILKRDDEYREFMRLVVKTKKSRPLAWKLTDVDDKYWNVFGRLRVMPTGDFQYAIKNVVDFEILEVV